MAWKDQEMKRWYKLRLLKFFLLIIGASISIAHSDDASRTEEGIKCSKINDRVQRLYCFDTLFNSPVPTLPVENTDDQTDQTDGPIKSLATLLERQRPIDDTNWIMRMRPWHETMLLAADDFNRIITSGPNQQPADKNSIDHKWTPEAVDVFLTMRETDVPEDRRLKKEAIMMLSCENDITTLAVLLPKPIKTLQANISLSSGNGSIFRLNWRDVENGSVVIAGRGLESIDTIKTIANYPRVQLKVNYPDDGSRVFIFDMNDLGSKLKPLRLACHW